MKADWRVVACDNVYVFHRGNGSFDDRDERYRKNVKIFFERHGLEYRRARREFVRADPFRELLSKVTEPPLPTWRRWLSTGKLVSTDLAGLHPKRAWRHFRERQLTFQYHQRAERYKSFWRHKRPTVTFLFESLGTYGGVMSVLKLVNGLIERGFEVRVASLASGAGLVNGLYTQPLFFANVKELIAGIADSDLFISTFWTTARWMTQLRDRFPNARFISYLQDFESWFEPNSATWVKNVMASYQIPDAIVTTSEWLRMKLLECGKNSHVISKGVDENIFRILNDEVRPPMAILAMARPHTPYRGFRNIVKVFRGLHKREPRVELSLFGCVDRSLGRLDFPVRNYGAIENGQTLARIYNRNTIYLDPSEFQGFGMMGLEAMACGSACVLTCNGGITQYAKDRCNSILIDPNEPESATEVILGLLRDESLRSNIVKRGLETAKHFSLDREIESFSEFLRGECELARSNKHGVDKAFSA
jgi:O-antigen biosynthesis protein